MSSFLKARLLTTIFLLQQDKAKYKFCLSEYHLTTGASKKGAPVFCPLVSEKFLQICAVKLNN